MPFLIFYITHPDESTAHRIGQLMVNRRLAACANISPVKSVFWWEGIVQTEGEWVSILKTRLELEQALEDAVMAEHPYQTPCILRFEARANKSYEDWIIESTGTESADLSPRTNIQK